MKAFLVALGLLLAVASAESDGFNTCWTYNDSDSALPDTLHPPTEWYLCAETCKGTQQSPINVELESVHQTTTMLPLSFSYTLGTFYAHNSGPYVDLHNPSPANYAMVDGFGQTYYLDGAHIHWHRSSDYGSEHAIAGRREVAEVHLVHFRKDFANLSIAVASGQMGAVSVVAVLFKEGTIANIELAKLVAVAPTIKYPENNVSVPISLFDPRVLLTKGSDALDYLHYNGSLTTPGCNEVVRWYILQKVSTLSSAQLAAIRAISHRKFNSTVPDTNENIRPMQELNGRTILAYPKLHALGVSIDSYSITAASAILGISCVGIIATIIAFIIITVRGHMAP